MVFLLSLVKKLLKMINIIMVKVFVLYVISKFIINIVNRFRD